MSDIRVEIDWEEITKRDELLRRALRFLPATWGLTGPRTEEQRRVLQVLIQDIENALRGD